MSVDTNKAIVERLDAILNNQDLGLLDELCSQDMVNHSLAPGRPTGLEGTRQWLATGGRKFQSFCWQELFWSAKATSWCSSGSEGATGPEAPSVASRSPSAATPVTLLLRTGSRTTAS